MDLPYRSLKEQQQRPKLYVPFDPHFNHENPIMVNNTGYTQLLIDIADGGHHDDNDYHHQHHHVHDSHDPFEMGDAVIPPLSPTHSVDLASPVSISPAGLPLVQSDLQFSPIGKHNFSSVFTFDQHYHPDTIPQLLSPGEDSGRCSAAEKLNDFHSSTIANEKEALLLAVEKGDRLTTGITASTQVLKPGEKKIGIYGPEARKVRLQQYREKRLKRNYFKVRYTHRQAICKRRPRINGRFVKKSVLAAMAAKKADQTKAELTLVPVVPMIPKKQLQRLTSRVDIAPNEAQAVCGGLPDSKLKSLSADELMK